MNTPAPAVACSGCGALHSPDPGDPDLCTACRRLLPSEPPWRAGGRGVQAAGHGQGAARFLAGRSLRRIAMAAGAALLVAGLGSWVAVRRHTLSEGWFVTPQKSFSQAWTAVGRHASEAWIALRRHAPFGAPQAERSASVAPATPPSRAAVREAPPVRGTRRHAQR